MEHRASAAESASLSGGASLEAFFAKGSAPLNPEGWATRQGMAEEESRRPSSIYTYNEGIASSQPHKQLASPPPPLSQPVDEALLAAEAQEVADLLSWDAAETPVAPAGYESNALPAARGGALRINPRNAAPLAPSLAPPLAPPPGRGWLQGLPGEDGTSYLNKLMQCRLQLQQQLDQQVGPTRSASARQCAFSKRACALSRRRRCTAACWAAMTATKRPRWQT